VAILNRQRQESLLNLFFVNTFFQKKMLKEEKNILKRQKEKEL